MIEEKYLQMMHLFSTEISRSPLLSQRVKELSPVYIQYGNWMYPALVCELESYIHKLQKYPPIFNLECLFTVQK